MSTTFAQLGVPPSIIDALAARDITSPFEIQAATIADTLAGRDVCGRAPTGSGKTLAFGIPLVIKAGRAEPRRPRALILAPTRELAEQITGELRSFAGEVRIGVVYGGVGYGPQTKALRQGVDILVACPGRLEDLLAQNELSLAAVERVVLDEADRMADMGFLPTVRRLLDQTLPDRQTILFSATLDGDVAKLTRDYQRDPVRHEVGEQTPDITAADHVFWQVTRDDRREVTAAAINAVWPAIVFTRTRHGADRLAKQLSKDGVVVAAIHGGRSQNQRTRALDDFARNKVHALIATDVAARGIHVDGVALVVHFDPPEDHKAYVHRSGRTARAGEGGVVLSLLQADQIKDAQRSQKLIGLDEPIGSVDAGALRDLAPGIRPARPVARPETQSAPRERSSESPRNGDRTRRGASPARKSKPQSDGRRSSGGTSDNRRPRPESSSGRNRDASDTRTGGASRTSAQGADGRRGGPSRDARDDARERNDRPGRDRSAGPRTGPAAKPAAGSKSGGAKAADAPRGSGAKARGLKARVGRKQRHEAGVDADGQPNRKARRSHLQFGSGRRD